MSTDKKEDKEGEMLFPELLKLSVSTDEDVTVGERILSGMTGLGLMIVEPIGWLGRKLGL